MKLIKYLYLTVIVLVALMIGGAAAVLILVDPNEYKPTIIQFANEATGRELSIPGDLELSLFPWIGLQLGEAQLSNAAGFKKQAFVKLEGVDIKVAFMPLLRGEVTAGVVTLKGLEVNLARQKDGRSNWDDLLGETQARQTATDSKTVTKNDQETSSEPMPEIGPVLVGGVEIIDANIHWSDAVDNMRVDLEGFNFKTGTIELNQPIDFETSFILKNHTPRVVVKAAVSARVHADQAFEKIDLQNLSFDFEIDDKDILGGTQTLNGGANIALNLPKQQYRIEPLNFQTGLQGDALPGKEMLLLIETSLLVDLEKQTADVQKTHIKTLGLDIQTQLKARQILGDVTATGRLSIGRFPLRPLLKSLDMSDALPETADPKVLQSVQVDTNFKGNLNSAGLSNLNVTLDDTTISGAIGIKQLSQTPSYKIEIAMDQIDLDRYLPPALEQVEAETEPPPDLNSKPESGASETSPPLSGDEPIELPLNMMRELDVEGAIKIGQLKIMNMKVNDFDAGIQAKEGVIDIKPMNVKLYNGAYKGNARIDVRTDQPKYEMSIDLNGVQSGPMLQDFMGKRKIEGELNALANIQTHGETVNQLMAALNGDFDLKFLDGALSMDVRQGLEDAKTRLKQKFKRNEELVADKVDQTPTKFSSIMASGRVDKGTVYNDNLEMRARIAYVTGQGLYQLPDEYVDYKATLVLSKGEAGQDDPLDDFVDLPMDFHMKGKLSELDYAGIAMKALGDAVKNKLSFSMEDEKAAARAAIEEQKRKNEAKLKSQQEKARKKLESEKKALAEKEAKLKEEAREAERKRKAEWERKQEEEKAKLEEEKKKKEEEMKKKLEEKKKKLLDRFKG